MTKRNRTYLKARYETGDTPTQTDYTDFIDSYILLGTSAGEPVAEQLFGSLTVTTAKATVVSAATINASSGNFTGTVSAGTINLTTIAASAASITGNVSARTITASAANITSLVSASGLNLTGDINANNGLFDTLVSASSLNVTNGGSFGGVVSASCVFATERVSAAYFRGGPFCGYWLSSASATNIVSASAFIPVNGVSSDFGNAVGFSLTSASSKIEYTSSVTANLNVGYNLSFTGQNNGIYEFAITKNGTVVSGSQQQRKVGTGTDIGAIGGQAVVTSVVSGDVMRIEVNSDTTGNMTAQRMAVTLKEV